MKELRVVEAKDATNEPCIEGYASVFDSWSEELGGLDTFKEKVVKGAFSQTIKEDDIRALFNHDPNYVLGRNKADTLQLKEDEKGLHVRIIPPTTQWAKDLMISISRGDITQMSFGFTVELDKWKFENGIDVRELLKVKLFDVSPVTFPAYSETECAIRSQKEVYKIRQAQKHEQEKVENEKRKQQLSLKKQKINLI
jgi:HK97 family phage prohead protease